ncbi:MAG: aryl-sulfate sulfotransferase, partial [Myxococcales bacterium]|nr:aryl-sulfate sulfotransferase [Myxococcales bacterium]
RPTKDWSHVNGVAYDPSDDTFVISARHLDIVFKMTRAGELRWVLGTEDPATTGDDGWPWLTLLSGRLPSQMHDPRILDDGTLLLYDNGVAVGFSRAVAYTIDPGAMTAGQDWEWIDPDWSPPLFGGYVGGVDALANGNVLIEHAGLGGFILDPFHSTWIHLSEVDPNEGEKVFEATIHGSVGYMGYRVRHMESLYPPSP